MHLRRKLPQTMRHLQVHGILPMVAGTAFTCPTSPPEGTFHLALCVVMTIAMAIVCAEKPV